MRYISFFWIIYKNSARVKASNIDLRISGSNPRGAGHMTL